MACRPLPRAGRPLAKDLAPSRLTVAEVLRAALPAYAAAHRMPAHHWKILNALLACRTPALGGHLYRCQDCGREHFAPHSCGNRHCPACQRPLAQAWLAQQQARLLPVPYFHVVFTLPHALNPLIRQNQRGLYNLLFSAASQTLLSFGAERFGGGQVGVTAVLHTWGQTLGEHYHLHCLVTGGAWQAKAGRWQAGSSRYLFNVRNLSAVFRAKYLAGVRRLFAKNELCFHGQLAPLAAPESFGRLLSEACRHAWVVYSKRPFAGPEQVLGYLSRYTHRIALGPGRLRALDLEHRTVTFAYKDYAAGARGKTMTLSLEEFTRRWLLHFLPERFVKIRHSGLSSHRDLGARLEAVRASLQVGAPDVPASAAASLALTAVPAPKLPAPPPALTRVCPSCGSARLERLAHFARPSRRLDSS